MSSNDEVKLLEPRTKFLRDKVRQKIFFIMVLELIFFLKTSRSMFLFIIGLVKIELNIFLENLKRNFDFEIKICINFINLVENHFLK